MNRDYLLLDSHLVSDFKCVRVIFVEVGSPVFSLSWFQSDLISNLIPQGWSVVNLRCLGVIKVTVVRYYEFSS